MDNYRADTNAVGNSVLSEAMNNASRQFVKGDIDNTAGEKMGVSLATSAPVTYGSPSPAPAEVIQTISSGIQAEAEKPL